MLTVTENTTQQINAALFEQDQNVKNKLSTVSGVVSAVYGAFNKLKDTLARVATTGSYNDLTDKPTIARVATTGSYNDLTDKPTIARVATTGSYNDLTDKPTIVDTVAQNVPNAVSSNAVYGALTNCIKVQTVYYGNVEILTHDSAIISYDLPNDCVNVLEVYLKNAFPVQTWENGAIVQIVNISNDWKQVNLTTNRQQMYIIAINIIYTTI